MRTIKKGDFFVAVFVWLSFFAFSATAQQQSETDDDDVYASKLTEVKSLVASFQEGFDTLKAHFDKEMKEVMDEIHIITDEMVARWGEENKILADLCQQEAEETTTTATKTTPQLTPKCTHETVTLEDQRRTEINTASHELPEKKMAVVDKYLAKFIQVEMDAAPGRLQIQTIIDYFINEKREKRATSSSTTNANANANTTTTTTTDETIAVIMEQYIDNARAQLQEYEMTEDAVEEMTNSLHEIMFGNICFTFTGVSLLPIAPANYKAFDRAMKKSLEIAFMREKVDFDIIAVKLIAQDYDEGQQKAAEGGGGVTRRNLRSTPTTTTTATTATTTTTTTTQKFNSGMNNNNNHERDLGRTQPILRAAIETAAGCRGCTTPHPTSDVTHRRRHRRQRRNLIFPENNHQNQRKLFETGVLDTLAQVLTVEMKLAGGGIFDGLESVESFHCSNFPLLEQNAATTTTYVHQ